MVSVHDNEPLDTFELPGGSWRGLEDHVEAAAMLCPPQVTHPLHTVARPSELPKIAYLCL